MIMQYNYSTDENGNNRVDKVFKGKTETRIDDGFGNNIYFRNDTIAKETTIKYFDRENGVIKSKRNSFGAYFDYNEDGDLVRSGNVDTDYHLMHQKEKIDNNATHYMTFQDSILIEETLDQKFNNDNYIKSTAYYDVEGSEECFEISVQSQISDNRIEFEQIQPGYIYRNEYDKNDNLVNQKCFIAANETIYKYDDKNNEIEESIWAKNKLIQTKSTDIIYDEFGRIKEKNIETKQYKEEA